MSNKKATFSLEVFIKILFTVIIVTFFFIFGSDLYAAVTGNRANQDTVKNFEALAGNLQFMIDKDTPFDFQSMVLYLDKKHLILGLAGSAVSGSEYPQKCENKPCLCLYISGSEVPSKPYSCKTFDNGVIFHGYGVGTLTLVKRNIFSQTPSIGFEMTKQPVSLYNDYPEELVLEYETLGLANTGEAIRSLYLEKFVKDGRTHVLVTANLNQDQIDKRNGLLAGCPQSSDDGCKGVQANSWVDVVNFCHYDLDAQRCILKSGVERCALDTRISGSCVCGIEFVNMSETVMERYCHERGFDGMIFLLEFDCVSLAQNSHNQGIGGCASYCNERPDTGGLNCDPDEQANCKLNPCGFTSQFAGNVCKVTLAGSRFECKADS